MKFKNTWDYKQPSFYRFSEDSVFLSKLVRTNKSDGVYLLDLCAGCGIVGLEVLRKSPQAIKKIDFCELQKEFLPYLTNNKSHVFEVLDYAGDSETLNTSFLNLEPRGKGYDIIVCNPPYFEKDSSRLPKNKSRAVCRHFIEGDLESLFITFKRLLSPEGMVYFCFPGESLKEINFFADKNDFKLHVLEKKERVLFFLMFSLNKN